MESPHPWPKDVSRLLVKLSPAHLLARCPLARPASLLSCAWPVCSDRSYRFAGPHSSCAPSACVLGDPQGGPERNPATTVSTAGLRDRRESPPPPRRPRSQGTTQAFLWGHQLGGGDLESGLGASAVRTCRGYV